MKNSTSIVKSFGMSDVTFVVATLFILFLAIKSIVKGNEYCVILVTLSILLIILSLVIYLPKKDKK